MDGGGCDDSCFIHACSCVVRMQERRERNALPAPTTHACTHALGVSLPLCDEVLESRLEAADDAGTSSCARPRAPAARTEVGRETKAGVVVSITETAAGSWAATPASSIGDWRGLGDGQQRAKKHHEHKEQ